MKATRVVVTMAMMAALAACAPAAKPATQPAASPPAAQPSPAAPAVPVGTESLVNPTVLQSYFVVLPDLASVEPAERAARATAMPPGVDVILKVQATAEIEVLHYLGTPRGDFVLDRPEIQRSPRTLSVLVGGPSEQREAVIRAGAACARAAAVAGHGLIADFRGGELFTLDEFDEHRPPGFAMSTASMITVQLWPDRKAKGTRRVETRGLTSFGLPELELAGAPEADAAAIGDIVLTAAQTLIERGALTAPGVLDVDVQRLTAGTWPQMAQQIAQNHSTGKVRFTAAWIEQHTEPRRISLDLPGGLTSERVHALVQSFARSPEPPTYTYDQLGPEFEAAAERARAALRTIAPRFAHGSTSDELLLVKVLMPIDATGDVTQWWWLPVVAFDNGEITFFLPRELGDYRPYNGGSSFHLPIARIADYMLVKDQGKTVISGGETNKFPAAKPRSRMRGKQRP